MEGWKSIRVYRHTGTPVRYDGAECSGDLASFAEAAEWAKNDFVRMLGRPAGLDLSGSAYSVNFQRACDEAKRTEPSGVITLDPYPDTSDAMVYEIYPPNIKIKFTPAGIAGNPPAKGARFKWFW